MDGESSNVRVAVRCRPMSSKEQTLGCSCCIQIDNGQVSIIDPDAAGKRDPKCFSYDFAYDWTSTQEEVHQNLGAPIVVRALQGYNATIFAYGQTGSGKTHTMMGGVAVDEVGIIPRLNKHLFSDIQALTDDTTKCLVTVSYLEIYNEVIHDLLNPKKEQSLRIREHPDLGIYVDGLCELVVHSEVDVLRLIEQGGAVRKVACTNMNERSSRSHSCFTIKVEKKTSEDLDGGDVQRETSLNSKINLVDLAGSERAKKTGATGSTLKEGSSINK
ncbi:unnamed protein product [Choristocarpus tenellus]